MDPEMDQIREIGTNIDGRPKGLRGRRFQNGRECDDRIARSDKFVAEFAFKRMRLDPTSSSNPEATRTAITFS
jgi:hypothetical protein